MTTLAAHLRIVLTALSIVLSALVLVTVVWMSTVAVPQIHGVVDFALLIWALYAS